MIYDNLFVNCFHERDLHPFLVRYLAKKMNVYSKTIYHEVSSKNGKGKSEWLHPDIVGFNIPVENWSEKVLELCGNFSISRATLYSFELKKSITIESLREQFFQAVSNSSWANEGYLVGVDIDVNNLELMQEMNRLSSAFGIGIIKLNLLNCEHSEILFQSRRKNALDGETMNKLFNINTDFQSFVQCVLDSIKINSTIFNKLDPVLSLSSLNERLKDRLKDSNKLKDKDVVKDIDSKSDDVDTSLELKDNKLLFITDNFTGLLPEYIKIEDEVIHSDSWRYLYLSVCSYLINKGDSLFIEKVSGLKGKKNAYFSKNKDDLRIAFLLDGIDLYAEVNFSANSIVSLISKLLKEYNINLNLVKIKVQ